MTEQNSALNCGDCTPLNCYRQTGTYPGFCLTEAADPAEIAEIHRR